MMALGEPSVGSAAPRAHDGDPLRELLAAGVFHPPKPRVRADRILRLQGYRLDKKIRPAIRESAARNAAGVAALVDPVLHYRRMPIRSLEADRLVLADGTALTCPAFAKFLADCDEVVAFVLTLGPGVDKSVMELSERFEMLDALLLETAGWLSIEACTKSFADALRGWARAHDRAVAMRMGPGYSYRLDGRDAAWTLEDQKPLFGLFAGSPLPVILLESCAMMPKMSRSGLFGLAHGRSRGGG